ncbi:MAG: hypothetical protein ACK4UN_00760 [Limisphaerales bacterium]
MKTPREILFQKHRATEDKLNAMRKEVLMTELPPAEKAHLTLFNSLHQLWIHLFQPSRRIWAGLAAVWLVILAANVVTQEETSSNYVSVPAQKQGPELHMALQEQRELVAELIHGPGREEADRPHYVPRPSSRRSPETRCA